MSKAFIAVNHGTGPIDLRHLGAADEMRPTEIHLKEDGAIGDKPSFTIVMTALGRTPKFGQLSLEMLNEALNELGYEIIKK